MPLFSSSAYLNKVNENKFRVGLDNMHYYLHSLFRVFAFYAVQFIDFMRIIQISQCRFCAAVAMVTESITLYFAQTTLVE